MSKKVGWSESTQKMRLLAVQKISLWVWTSGLKPERREGQAWLSRQIHAPLDAVWTSWYWRNAIFHYVELRCNRMKKRMCKKPPHSRRSVRKSISVLQSVSLRRYMLKTCNRSRHLKVTMFASQTQWNFSAVCVWFKLRNRALDEFFTSVTLRRTFSSNTCLYEDYKKDGGWWS